MQHTEDSTNMADIFSHIFHELDFCILHLKFVPQGLIGNESALFQVTARWQTCQTITWTNGDQVKYCIYASIDPNELTQWSDLITSRVSIPGKISCASLSKKKGNKNAADTETSFNN